MNEGRSTRGSWDGGGLAPLRNASPLGADPDESYAIAALSGACVGVGAGVPVGIGDDAAVLPDGSVVTVDTMVEGTHWDARLTPADVGWKLVAVNVSDIAAMGATPTWAVLALTLPAPMDRAWVDGFARGVGEACAAFGVALVGGDTTRGPVRTLSLTMGGAPTRAPVLRSGGQPGDDLWVTGSLGRAAEAMLADTPSLAALAHLRRPVPPLAFAGALGASGCVHAMMDLSDGLRADLARLCAASGVGARVDAQALPGNAPLAWRTSYGEDYELLFTSPRAARDAIASSADMHSISLHRIGVLTSAPDVALDGHSDAPAWPAPRFTHFGASGAEGAV